jgi:spore maturation protein CgeB
MFEALACGIPLISAPWEDSEGLFRAGTDYLVARNGAEMQQRLAEVLSDETEARAMAARGVTTILERHTCAHRVTELLAIVASLQTPADATASARAP